MKFPPWFVLLIAGLVFIFGIECGYLMAPQPKKAVLYYIVPPKNFSTGIYWPIKVTTKVNNI